MKSYLVLTVVFLLNHHFTHCSVCEIPEDDEYLNCVVSQNYNVKTIQGEFYSFKSDCILTLLNFEKDGEEIRVETGNKKVNIFIGDKTYTLSLNKEILLTTAIKTYKLPVKEDIVEASKPGYFAIFKFPSIGLNVKWDGLDNIVLEVDNNKDLTFSGICAKECTENIPEKTSRNCYVKEPQQCPFQTKTKALQYCRNLLRNKKFSRCTKVTHVNSFISQCQLAYCNCKLSNINNCMCDLFDALVKHCEAKTGQSLSWREKNLCEKKCKNPNQRYNECGPPQKACGEAALNNNEAVKCVEGCTCPLNLFLSDGKCIPEKECPCRYENMNYPPGRSIVQDCKTCVCIGNNQWDCPPGICYGEADVIGDPHYTTFDGKRFDFMGKCTYYLVKGVDFTITADHYVLEHGKFVKNFKSKAPSWTKVLQISYGDDVITLKPNLVVTFNDKELKEFPYKKGNITISKPTGNKLIVELPNYLQVHWDGYSAAKIRAPTTMRGYIQGLMGNFNKDPKDDFLLPDGTTTNDPNKFGHSWKVDGSCEDENTDPIPHPCKNTPKHKAVAEKACSALTGNLFKDCREYNPKESYESCVYDCCLAVEMGEKCACETITAHASRCLNKKIQWRKQVPACEVKCPEGLVYNYCLNPCESSCDNIGINPNCQKQCLEGCGCPEGQTLDENNKCIKIEKCKCKLNGKYFPSGYKIRDDKSIKMCKKGKWENSPINENPKDVKSIDDLKVKCENITNSEYTPCKSRKSMTCKNMDKYQKETQDESCQEGCECSEGFVLDTISNNCVLPQDCPCFFNGKSYDDSTERKIINGKCLCKARKWECTKNEDAMEKCSVFSDTNIRNFDGKLISFESECEYTLARGQFNNKAYVINIKSGDATIAYLNDKNERIAIEVKKDSPGITNAEEIIDFNATKMIDIETIGIRVVWSKEGYHILFKPENIDKVEGLCNKINDPNTLENKDNLKDFVDSWNNDPSCFELNIPTNKESYDIDGKPTPTKCDILKDPKFEQCSNHIPIDEYYNKCIITEQNQENNLEVTEDIYCPIISTFAQECTDINNPIEWRSSEFCPIDCPKNTVYNNCINTCTCEDVEKFGKCPERSCIEGCATTKCPEGNIFANKSYTECISIEECNKKKCLKDLEEKNDDNCKCENGEIVCDLEPDVDFEVPPEDKTENQMELYNVFKNVKTSLQKINEPNIHKSLPPKDKQILETFQDHIMEFENEVKCQYNLKNTEKCKCINDEEVCGLSPKNQAQSEHEILNNLELIKFMQTHLKCLEDEYNNPQNCTCISGKKVCPEKEIQQQPTISTTSTTSTTTTTSKPTLYLSPPKPISYYYISKCERRVVVSLYKVYFAKKGYNCLKKLEKDPLKKCVCENEEVVCSKTLQENPVKSPEGNPEGNQQENRQEKPQENRPKNVQENRPKNVQENRQENPQENRPENVQENRQENPQENPQENIRIPKETSMKVYNEYLEEAKKQLQCQAKIANRKETCWCEKGEEVCQPKPEPIPEDNNFGIIKNYMDSPVNKTEVYNQFQKGLECTEDLGDDSKVCTCLNGEKDCFDMDFESPIEVPPSDGPDPIKETLTKLDETKTQIICVMRRDRTPKCSKYQPNDVNSTYNDVLQLNVYLQYLRHVNEQLACLRDKPSYCVCVSGKQKCSFDGSNIRKEQEKENKQLNNYNNFLDHINAQMECLSRLNRQSSGCFCDNGYEKCEPNKNYVLYPLLDDHVLEEYDSEIIFPEVERQLECYNEIKGVSNKCSCRDGIARCEKPPVSNEPEPNDDFSQMKKNIPNQINTIVKIDKKIYCIIKNGNSRYCREVLPTSQHTLPVISQPDKQLLKTYNNYINHIKLQLTCFGDVKSNNCICSNGQLICGMNIGTSNVHEHRMRAVNSMNVYGYFINYVDSQLNCLASLNNERYNCGEHQICGLNHHQNKLIPLIDINTSINNNRIIRYSHINSQLNCLFEIKNRNKDECYCSNGMAICKNKQQPTCPEITCPNNAKLIKKCENCCPECESCVVKITSNGSQKLVTKQLGETWMENICKECRCVKDNNEIYIQCRHVCPTFNSKIITYEGCEHNGKFYPPNTIISETLCETLSCIRNQRGEIVKHHNKTTCSGCRPGFIYVSSDTQCCGECRQNGCEYNNEMKQHGEVWYSEDKCFKMKCFNENGRWVLYTTPKMCRPIGPCYGVIEKRDCCDYCNTSV